MLRTLFFAAALFPLAHLQAAEKVAQPDPAAKIEAALDQSTEVQYLDTMLSDVMLDLELRHRIEIEIDREAVEAAVGKNLDEIVITCSMKDLPLASTLNHLLTPKGLTWAISDGVLLFTSIDMEPKYVQTKVYKIGDFATDLEAIQNVLETSIDASTWQSNGGTFGAIAKYDDTKSLVITHTARAHRRIAKLIGDLREAKASPKQ